MSSKKTEKTEQNSTQTAAPPSFTMPGLENVAGAVTNAVNQIPATHYSGQQVAYMSPEELAGIQGAWGDTAALAGEYTDWMGNQLTELSTPFDYTTNLSGISEYDMGSMYDVQPVIAASLAPVQRNLMENILPGISSSALDAGAYSGDRAMSVLPMSALQTYSREAADIAAQIGYQNYQDFEDRRLSAWDSNQDNIIGAYGAETDRGVGMTAANTGMLTAQSDYISNILKNSASVGDLLNMAAQLGVTVDQAMIDDQIAKDKYASYAPFMGLDQASQLLTQLSGGYGTQTGQGTSTTTTKTSGMGEVVKGVAGIGAMVAGAMTGNPLMMAGGAQTAGSIGISPTADAQAGNAFASQLW